jgi:hypothetical protein
MRSSASVAILNCNGPRGHGKNRLHAKETPDSPSRVQMHWATLMRKGVRLRRQHCSRSSSRCSGPARVREVHDDGPGIHLPPRGGWGGDLFPHRGGGSSSHAAPRFPCRVPVRASFLCFLCWHLCSQCWWLPLRAQGASRADIGPAGSAVRSKKFLLRSRPGRCEIRDTCKMNGTRCLCE